MAINFSFLTQSHRIRYLITAVLILTASFVVGISVYHPQTQYKFSDNVELIVDTDNNSLSAVNLPSEIVASLNPTTGQTIVVPTKASAVVKPTTHSIGDTLAQPTPTNVVTPTNTTLPTATPESQTAYVAFYADPQSDTDIEDSYHQRVVNYILARGSNPIFNAGDLMENGTQDSLNRFNAVTATLRSSRTFYSALGNNDRVEGDSSTPSSLFLNNFSFPGNERWYSVNVRNLHLIVLDSAFAASSQTQKNWLAADLQSANSQNRITGVMFHHPSYASSIASYLNSYNADFVIMGHNHAYQYYAANDVDYFVASGQPNIGYFTLRVYTTYATLTAYNQNNGLIATVTINNR